MTPDPIVTVAIVGLVVGVVGTLSILFAMAAAAGSDQEYRRLRNGVLLALVGAGIVFTAAGIVLVRTWLLLDGLPT
jgi:uncharacterized membrane protein